MPYAPLYCATSSPRINVFGLLSSSSARASFNASRTVTSLVPLSVAYPRARRIEGAQADFWKVERKGVAESRDESRRAAGRKCRGAAIAVSKSVIPEVKRTKRLQIASSADEDDEVKETCGKKSAPEPPNSVSDLAVDKFFGFW